MVGTAAPIAVLAFAASAVVASYSPVSVLAAPAASRVRVAVVMESLADMYVAVNCVH